MMYLTTFQNSDYKIWQGVITFSIICVIMLVANTLRRKIPFLKKILLPTAVIAGFLGLGIKYLLQNVKMGGIPLITNEFFETVTYHSIAIGFIALGLKTIKSEQQSKNDGTAIKSGLLIVSTYLVQGIVGLLVTIAFGFIFKEVAQYAGLLLPMGFGQGPGQANNIGQLFEDAGFTGGKAFGLSISTLGFVWACIPGIIYINHLSKKGLVKKANDETGKQVLQGEVESEDEIPLTEAVDKLTIQICFVGFIYVITWGCMSLVAYLIRLSGVNFLINNVIPLVWGFNFVFAIVFTMLFKKFLNKLYEKRVMKRRYTNNYMLNRISGVAFDFMIVSSIMAIEVENLSNIGLIITLLVLTSIGGLVTFFYVRYACKKLYPTYPFESTAAMFGMLTGTASTGIALLREIDPKFETQAADDLVLGSSTAVIFGGPILLIVGFIYNPEWYWLYGSLVGMILFFAIIWFFLFVFKKKNKKKIRFLV